MARFNDPNFVAAAFGPYLQPGEQIRNIAFGVKPPSMALVIPLIILGVLPGIIVMMMTKEFVLALTDRRVLILRFKGSQIRVQEVMEYPLYNTTPVEASTGAIHAVIKINDPARPFFAKFHRAGMPGNREQAMAIAAALSQPPYQQQPYTQQYYQQYPQQYPQQQYQPPPQPQYPGQPR
jgi:hypothetical protein